MMKSAFSLLLLVTSLIPSNFHSTQTPNIPYKLSPIDPHKLYAYEKQMPQSTGMKANDYLLNLDSVKQIVCGTRAGTAVVVGKNMLVTADHVLGDMEVCSIEGIPAVVTFRDKNLDYAVVRSATAQSQYYSINCSGIKKDDPYFATGYGNRNQAVTLLIATEFYINSSDIKHGTQFARMRLLSGAVYQGMSGGPIVNIKGELVGLINANNEAKTAAISREMSDTYFCRNKLLNGPFLPK